MKIIGFDLITITIPMRISVEHSLAKRKEAVNVPTRRGPQREKPVTKAERLASAAEAQVGVTTTYDWKTALPRGCTRRFDSLAGSSSCRTRAARPAPSSTVSV